MPRQLAPDRSLWDAIAVEVRRQRESHGLSGNRLAQLLGCDRSTVSNWTILRQAVGGPEVMKGQLAHLLEMSLKPNVNIRVVDQAQDYHVGLDGSFRLLTVEDRDLAFSESPGRGRLVLDPTSVQAHAQRYDRISNVAAPLNSSRELIERAMEAL